MKSKAPKPFSRQGLHRLECDCGAYTYATVANLEAHGLPLCRCGGEHLPDRLELAQLLGLEDAPVVLEYERACNSVSHGQAGPGRHRIMPNFRAPELIASERVERNRATAARKRRLNALKPALEPMPF